MLATLTIAAAAWMFVEYIRYARSSHLAMQAVKDGTCFKRHQEQLRNVFLECGCIHLFTMIVAWFWTPHFIVVALVLHNAWQSHQLNRAKLEVLAAQEYAALRKSVHEARNNEQRLSLENSTLREQLEPHIKRLEGQA